MGPTLIRVVKVFETSETHAHQFARGFKHKDSSSPNVGHDPVAGDRVDYHGHRFFELAVAEAGHQLPIQGQLRQLSANRQNLKLSKAISKCKQILKDQSTNAEPSSPVG